MPKRFVTDLDVRGKRVLVRCDLNVPLKDGEITDDRRIRASLETIRWLQKNGARVILMSHLGRPDGTPQPSMSLRPVAERLGELLRQEVLFAEDAIGPPAQARLQALGDGGVLLLENLRFHAGEEKGDPGFAKALASLGELFVNDAFGTSHRPHASMVGVAKELGGGAMGFLLKKELDYLGDALREPKRPFVAIIGGAKISSKIGVIEHLLEKVDTLIVGGGMAYTFFKAMGREIGKSLLDKPGLEAAKKTLATAQRLGKDRLLLPEDVVAADRYANDANTVVASTDAMPADREGLDIGPKTIERFTSVVRAAKTVVWNGPMGVFEMPSFAKGTNAVAAALVDATRAGATTIIGGGDSAAAIEAAGLAEKVSHVSTGGGASLEFLEGRRFEPIEVLTDA